MQTDLSEQLKNAMYLPAISIGYGEMAASQTPPRPMPAGLSPHDLNFLDPSSQLFYLPCCLYSPGNVKDLDHPVPTMLDTRDRQNSHVLADSGGYQIINGGMNISSVWQRKRIFNWQSRHCDFGMTLDVPTASIANEKSSYTSFEQCLADTHEHLKSYKYFYDQRKLPLLNVMQGRNGEEADRWYAMARQFRFDGWAFAGDLKDNMYEVLRRVFVFVDEGRLNKQENWIHFLGKGAFSFAVLLTCVRDGIRQILGDNDFHISMDTSSPGLAAGRFRKVLTTPNFCNKSFTLHWEQFPFNDYRYFGSEEPFLWQHSPIAKYLKMGDLIVKNDDHASSRLDMLSACYLMNHNYYVYSKAMIDANKLLSQHPAMVTGKVPFFVQNAKQAIEEVFSARDPVAELERPDIRRVLDKVR